MDGTGVGLLGLILGEVPTSYQQGKKPPQNAPESQDGLVGQIKNRVGIGKSWYVLV